MWDCIAEIAAKGGQEIAQPWPATAEKPSPKRRSPSATRSVQQGVPAVHRYRRAFGLYFNKRWPLSLSRVGCLISSDGQVSDK